MDYDKLWQQGNWKDRTNAHRVPALIMSGWFDDNGMGTTEALELYHDYQEKKVILDVYKRQFIYICLCCAPSILFTSSLKAPAAARSLRA